MKPPPPRLPAAGYTTASAKATAMAASTALPPRRRTSTPTCDAILLVEATMPCRARTGSREAAKATPLSPPDRNGGATVERKKTRKRRILAKIFVAIVVSFTDRTCVGLCVLRVFFAFFAVKESLLHRKERKEDAKDAKCLRHHTTLIIKNQLHVNRSLDRVESVRLHLSEAERAVERLRLAHRG